MALWSYSQQEGWSILNLGHNITTNNKYAVGGTCLIFAESSSRTVFGFNVNTGKWSSITVSTTLPWTVAHSHGNTAMIVNDSLAVFYSAYNGNFATLRFKGQKINATTIVAYSPITNTISEYVFGTLAESGASITLHHPVLT